jgi:hypothetical protein
MIERLVVYFGGHFLGVKKFRASLRLSLYLSCGYKVPGYNSVIGLPIDSVFHDRMRSQFLGALYHGCGCLSRYEGIKKPPAKALLSEIPYVRTPK